MEEKKYSPGANGEQVDNRTHDYDDANDRATFMTDLEKVQADLETKGYTEQFRVEKEKLVGVQCKKSFKAKEVNVVNFYRFEGLSNPDDMSILYVIETGDGCKGTLTDGYGRFSDEETSAFMKQVDIHKKTEGM